MYLYIYIYVFICMCIYIYIYIYIIVSLRISKDWFLKLQQSAQSEEQYKNDGLRNNSGMPLKVTQSTGINLTIDLKSVTDHPVVKSDPQHTAGSNLTHYRSKMGVIYMESWKQCALPVITKMTL